MKWLSSLFCMVGFAVVVLYLCACRNGAIEANQNGGDTNSTSSNESNAPGPNSDPGPNSAPGPNSDPGPPGGNVPAPGTLTLEVMIGTDSGVGQKYGTRLGCYVKELMAQVNYMYNKLKPELNINVVLSRHEADVDLHGLPLSQDGVTLLNSWNTWVPTLNNPPEGSPNHFDYAVLVTSSGAGRGLAPANARMCTGWNKAFVGEEGPMTAKIIAHEMAHGFGVGHDDDPTMIMNNMPGTAWSDAAIATLLQVLPGSSSCMQNYLAPSIYTGIPMISYEDQCQGFFGTSVCDLWGPPTSCDVLLCQSSPGQCGYDVSTPLDGTSCGQGRWCVDGKCVDIPTNDPSTLFDGCIH